MSNFLQKIFGGASQILNSTSSSSAIGIDVGSSAIKMVEIKKKGGKAVLETYGAIALGPYDEKEIGRVTNLSEDKIAIAIAELLKQSGATTNLCGLSIPVQSSLVFTMDLPIGVKEEEIPAIVPIEARKHIPVPITEVALDYFILPEREPSFEEMNTPGFNPNKEKSKEVLAVAIQNEVVSKLKSVVTQANLSASFFEVEIFSSVRANLEHELYPVMIIDFGASRTKLSFVEFGMVKHYHTVNRGGADISQSISQSLSIPFVKAEELKKEYGIFGNSSEKDLADIIRVHLDYIFSEINSVLLNYERKYGKTISKVILTGGGSMLKGLQDLAVSNFKAEVEIGHSFSKVDAPVFLEKVLDVAGPEFSIAIGLALRKLQN